VIFSENQILEYQLLDDQGSDRWWSNPTNHAGDSDDLYYGNARYPNVLSSQGIPNLIAKLVRSMDIPLDYQGRAVSSAIISFRLLSLRGVSRRNIRLWVFGSLLLGVAAPLAIVAIYPKLIRERCKTCGKSRRVDLALCESCGASWGIAEPSDITIIEAKVAFPCADGASHG